MLLLGRVLYSPPKQHWFGGLELGVDTDRVASDGSGLLNRLPPGSLEVQENVDTSPPLGFKE